MCLAHMLNQHCWNREYWTLYFTYNSGPTAVNSLMSYNYAGPSPAKENCWNMSFSSIFAMIIRSVNALGPPSCPSVVRLVCLGGLSQVPRRAPNAPYAPDGTLLLHTHFTLLLDFSFLTLSYLPTMSNYSLYSCIKKKINSWSNWKSRQQHWACFLV